MMVKERISAIKNLWFEWEWERFRFYSIGNFEIKANGIGGGERRMMRLTDSKKIFEDEKGFIGFEVNLKITR
jgi:hypothetical protein